MFKKWNKMFVNNVKFGIRDSKNGPSSTFLVHNITKFESWQSKFYYLFQELHGGHTPLVSKI